MSRNVILFIAQSLDGYIATDDESLDWLFRVEGEGDNGYLEFYDTVDTILMGRRTYDWILREEKGRFPYEGKTCHIFSKTAHEPDTHVAFVSGDVVAFVNALKASEGKSIWIVGGGELIAPLVQANAIDEYIITLAPVLIGSGIPLFKRRPSEVGLVLGGVRRFGQFVELHYMKKPEPKCDADTNG